MKFFSIAVFSSFAHIVLGSALAEKNPMASMPATSYTVRVVAISDTHARHRELVMPDGDILIHAGDFTNYGKRANIDDFNRWLGELPYERIFVVSGNHEHPNTVGRDLSALLSNATYLNGTTTTYRGINIYGFGWAFNQESWRFKPNTHIVITHQAPTGLMGGTSPQPGCDSIAKAIFDNPPFLHIFGHHHSERGVQTIEVRHKNVLFANAAAEAKKLKEPMVFDVVVKNGEVVAVEHIAK